MEERIETIAPQLAQDAAAGLGKFVEGFSLSGDYVKGLTNKKFKIISEPFYEETPDLDHPEKMRRKLVLMIKLIDGTEIKYLPNKTSQNTIISKRGYALKNWVDYEGEFFTAEQMVGKDLKNVIYIKEAK